jgi:hypothetical protein
MSAPGDGDERVERGLRGLAKPVPTGRSASGWQARPGRGWSASCRARGVDEVAPGDVQVPQVVQVGLRLKPGDGQRRLDQPSDPPLVVPVSAPVAADQPVVFLLQLPHSPGRERRPAESAAGTLAVPSLVVLVDTGVAEIAVSQVGVLGPTTVLAHQGGDDGQLVQRPVPPRTAPPGNPAESSVCTSNEVWQARTWSKMSAFDTLSNLARQRARLRRPLRDHVAGVKRGPPLGNPRLSGALVGNGGIRLRQHLLGGRSDDHVDVCLSRLTPCLLVRDTSPERREERIGDLPMLPAASPRDGHESSIGLLAMLTSACSGVPQF